MRISIKNTINYAAVFIIFSGALSIRNLSFADSRGAYLIIFFATFLLLPFVKGLYFNRAFLTIFLTIAVFSLYNVFIGKDTLTLFTKQFVGIFTSAFFFYLLIRINRYDIKELFRVYLNIAFIVALLGIIQEISYVLRFKSGYDFSCFLPSWRPASAEVCNLLKLNSILPEPGHFCNVMMPAFFVSLTTFLKGQYRFQKRWKSIIIITAFFLTFSASGYMGALFAILLLAYLYRGKMKNVILGCVVICLSAFLLYNNITDIRSRINSTIGVLTGKESLETAHISTHALLSNALVSYYTLKDSPLVGHGLGSHEISYRSYIGDILPQNIYRLWSNLGDADSLFLRLVSETGLFGVVSFFIFIFKFHISKRGDATQYWWIVNNAVLTMFFIKLLRMGHYFIDGFFFFFWVYYFSKKISENNRGAKDVAYR